jgi:hypothetical protein
MLSTWFGFKHVGPHVKHDTNSKWRRMDNIIHAWITKAHMAEPSFPLPDKGNIIEQLAVMCRGSPKMRMFLHAITDKVILKQRRVIIWRLIPAHHSLAYFLFLKSRCTGAIGTSSFGALVPGHPFTTPTPPYPPKAILLRVYISWVCSHECASHVGASHRRVSHGCVSHEDILHRCVAYRRSFHTPVRYISWAYTSRVCISWTGTS